MSEQNGQSRTPGAEMVLLLRAILSELKGIRAVLDKGARGGSTSNGKGSAAGPSGAVASERELDGQYGNPTVKRDPARWKGESFEGHLLSECSPEFLDAFAEFKDFCADNPRDGDDPKWARYARKDAALARGWARRLRSGWVPSAGHGAVEDDAPL